MVIEKPAVVFDRTHEWNDLVRFATDPKPGLRIGIVGGRRRYGKSFLLRHLCREVGGIYTLALQQSRAQALDRFGDALGASLGARPGRFSSWVDALDYAADTVAGRQSRHPPLIVLDEFPYLVAHSPELPSVVQAFYDERGPHTGQSALRVILCGSAVSTMSTLLAGDQALRGRAVLDMRVGPFRYRDAAEYWGAADADTAFLVDAVLGGAPGYRAIVGEPPEPGDEGLFRWLEQSLFNPSHALFTEPDHLLAEDPRMTERATYQAIWEAAAGGATTPAQIGGVVGIDAKALAYHLNVMTAAGFLRYDQDLLLQRKPVITAADPVVRFHELFVRPNLDDLEAYEARGVWDRSRDAFSSRVLGPHFEDLARRWTRWHAREQGLNDIGSVGSSVIACRRHRGHEIDVVALARGSRPRVRGGAISLLGEAKCTNKPRGPGELRRLEHVRDLLAAQGWDVGACALAVYSRSGFEFELAGEVERGRVHLVGLGDLYGGFGA